MNTAEKIAAARQEANHHKLGTPEFEAAMQKIQQLVIMAAEEAPRVPPVILLHSHGRKNYRTIKATA